MIFESKMLLLPSFTVILILLNDADGQLFFGGGPNKPHPNILIFIADDLGHADVGYSEGNLQTPTPNIDKYAWDGVILSRHYANSMGTPSRGAFLTAKNAISLGLQTSSIHSGEPWGLALDAQIQPQFFKTLGYSTHAIGKWHLGESQRAYFPNKRGFDSWFGFSSSSLNWFNYTEGWVVPFPTSGRVLRDQGIAVPSNVTNNVYAPDLFTSRAEKIIRDSDPKKPFYMYFATPVPHTAFADYRAVQQTMPQYDLRPAVLTFSDQFPERKKQLAAIQALDESFKRLIDALVFKNIINNTIIVFLSDNGAPLPAAAPYLRGSNHGSNWPLRHGKGTLFEGGVRTLAFIWTPLISKRGRISKQLFHITDWLPTLYEAVGQNPADLAKIDGISQWQALVRSIDDGPRTEVLLNIDPRGQAGMIYQDLDGVMYKYIVGNVFDNAFTGWSRTEGTSESVPMISFSAAAVKCNFPSGAEVSICRSWEKACLFDLTNDPCETNNIAASNQAMVHLLAQKLSAFNSSAVRPALLPFDQKADPANWGGIWVPWLDENLIIDPVMPFYEQL